MKNLSLISDSFEWNEQDSALNSGEQQGISYQT
jgi:hypothetical protein